MVRCADVVNSSPLAPGAQILVTGADGFIGRSLCRSLIDNGYRVTGTTRVMRRRDGFDQNVHWRSTGDLVDFKAWPTVLRGVDAVIHLAARVHVMGESPMDALDAYRHVNVAGTQTVAEHARDAGVKRFIFLSSVKVNGAESTNVYDEYCAPVPGDAYGVSKMEAENMLKAVTSHTDMQYVIIRPPLVYGPGVSANFLSLVRLVKRKVPLPLGSIRNRRSLIFIDNLVDCILVCLVHPAAANQTYLVSDDDDVSTPELIRLTADALNVPCFLFPFPVSVLRFVGRLANQDALIERVLGSLTVNISKIKSELAWRPTESVASGLEAVSNWYSER